MPGALADAGAGPRIGATTTAAAAPSAAITAKTVPGLETASSTPVAAGAASTLVLSTQPERTFAAVSSSGVRASAGSSVACAGRVSVTAVAASAAHA